MEHTTPLLSTTLLPACDYSPFTLVDVTISTDTFGHPTNHFSVFFCAPS